MQKHLRKDKRALSSLSLIILLLIAAIIGGIISYLWVTGYYMSLKEKIPEQDAVAITNLSFDPKNATIFNATVLNPSYSPDPVINVTEIAITGETEDTLHYVATTPSLPCPLPRGTNQTFTCTSNWAQYVNQTVTVSAFVKNGSGSTSSTKLPYTALEIDKVDFNSTIGVNSFNITLRNNPLSATYVNITGFSLPEFTPPINFTALLQPSLPFTLFPNKSETFLCNYNWLTESRIGGPYGSLNVTTLQGYTASYSVQVPKLAPTIQAISFNPADTTHFKLTVKNQASTNTYLNVTRIHVLLDNGTAMNVTTTPLLNPSTNGVLGNQTTTFMCNWNWTNYRNRNVIATVYTLQGINATNTQKTPPAGLLTITGAPVFPDTQHILVTVQNSPYSTKPANVTMIQVQLENGTYDTISGVSPRLPRLVGGNSTMFSVPWNWANYTNKNIDILIYTNEGYSTFYALTTPSNISNYKVYLSISSAIFSKTDNTHFFVNVTNSASSVESANVTRITVLLENGTEINATITSQMVPINSNATFACGWDWSTYLNKSIVIRVYTSSGLRAIYVTKTS